MQVLASILTISIFSISLWLQNLKVFYLFQYARETDSLLAAHRRENRQKLFKIYPEIQKSANLEAVEDESKGHEHELYKEQFGTRFIVKCEYFRLRLQADVAEEGREEVLRNVRMLTYLLVCHFV